MNTKKEWELIVSREKATAHFLINTEDLEADDITFDQGAEEIHWDGKLGPYFIRIEGSPAYIVEMLKNGQCYLALKSDLSRKIKEFKVPA